MKDRRGRVVSSAGKASVRPLERPLDDPGDEAVTGIRGGDAPVDRDGPSGAGAGSRNTSGVRSTRSDAPRAHPGSTG